MKNFVFSTQVVMSDGVQLYTVIQLPKKTGKFPLVIIRTPYAAQEPDFEELAKQDTHGYAVLIQHCRGTGCSGGECNAYVNERRDGLELLAWIRQQPFYNGELFLSGTSYLSSVHFAYMDTDPSDIKAAFLPVQDSERYNILYRNGFFKTGLHGKWVMSMHKRNQNIERNITEKTFLRFPLAGVTEDVFNEKVPYIEEEFLHPDPADPYWSTPAGGGDFKDVCNKCRIPILLVTAFYDIYTGGVFDMWENLSPERRKDCALLVTPFDHSYNPLPENITEEMQSFRSTGLLREIVPGLEYAWFDHFRKGTPLPFGEKGKVTYYRLWDDQWITSDNLLNAPAEKSFYLTADRQLTGTIPAPGEISYTFDPRDPAEFIGGVCNNFGGMKYQPEPNSRQDIISFVSDPLAEDMICEGRIEVELACASSAEDTCFYVRLDFERNGKTLSLRDDIDSLCRVEKSYIPDRERVLKFTFAPHAFKLLAGDRLRLDVSSSCVPYFQVHTNFKGEQSLLKEVQSCRNKILIGKSKIRFFTV